jgi:hypothetical protein
MMGGFEFSNVPDYQTKLDILAAIMPFRPGMFVLSNQVEILRLCDGQIEIAEDQLREWANNHSEDGNSEIKCRVVGANPLTVKILSVKDPEQEIIESNFRDGKQRQRRRQQERRSLR